MLFNYLLMAFVTEHPGVALAVIGGLFSLIVSLIAAYWKMIANRLDKLEETDAQLSGRVKDVEETLVEYKEHIGAGDAMFKQLMDRVERHMTEEEDQVWSGITDLSNKLSAIHEDNLKAHTVIVERLAKVEAKMPNGQLNEVLDLVRKLAERK